MEYLKNAVKSWTPTNLSDVIFYKTFTQPKSKYKNVHKKNHSILKNLIYRPLTISVFVFNTSASMNSLPI